MQKYLFLFIPVRSYLFRFRIIHNSLFCYRDTGLSQTQTSFPIKPEIARRITFYRFNLGCFNF